MRKSKTGISGHTTKGKSVPKNPMTKVGVAKNGTSGPAKSMSKVHKKVASKKAASPKKA